MNTKNNLVLLLISILIINFIISDNITDNFNDSKKEVFAQETAAGQFSTYTNEKYGITMQYPSDWTKTEGEDEVEDLEDLVEIVKFSKDIDYYEGEVSLYLDQNQSLSLQEYLSDTIKIYEDSYDDFKLLSSNANTDKTLSGHPAYFLGYTLKEEVESNDTKYLELGAKIGNDFYNVEYSAEEGDHYDESLPIAQKMIDSIKIGNDAATSPLPTSSQQQQPQQQPLQQPLQQSQQQPQIIIPKSNIPPAAINGQNQQLIDKIAIKITEAKPSVDYVSLKKVLEKLALQKENKGENVQESLTQILNQVSQNPENIVVDNIANLALKESSSNTQQQPPSIQKQNQVTPQPTNDFSHGNDNTVSDKALEIDPTNIDALVKKSKALYAQDRFDEAIQYLDKILQIEPNNIVALNNKGVALLMLDKDEEAITYYDKVIQIDPNHTVALNNKGNALYTLKKYDESIKYLDKVIQIDPNHTVALNNKGEALSMLDKDEEAITYYDKVIQIDPNNIDALSNKGDSLYYLDRNDEAITYYDKILQIEPNNTYALYMKNTALNELYR
jgi:tetratricopeptide (TPR) repeat protein